MNNSDSSKSLYSDVLIFSYGYFMVGILAIVLNLVIVFVYTRHAQLFKTGALVLGLCLGDVIYCTGHVASGWNRIAVLTVENPSSMDAGRAAIESITVLECSYRGPLFWLLGAMMQSVTILAISVDRLVAVSCYVWYFNNRTTNPRRQWSAVAMLFLFSVASSFTVWFTLDLKKQIPALCFPETYMTPFHTYYHYSFNALAGVLSCIIGIMVAIVYFLKKKSLSTAAGASPMPPLRPPSDAAVNGGNFVKTILVGQKGSVQAKVSSVQGGSLRSKDSTFRGSFNRIRGPSVSVRAGSVADHQIRVSVVSMGQQQEASSVMSKELRLSITMLVIGILDMVLVVVPHVIMTAIKMGNYGGDTASYLNYAAGFLIGFRCLVSIFVYFGLNTDFRLATMRMFVVRRASIAPQ